jgi:predicted DsbA family dithiol-disulfide isomerase
LAHQLAVESPHVTADVIEVSEFPEILQRYHVRGVPKTIINERIAFEGALPEAALLNRVVEAAAAGTGL